MTAAGGVTVIVPNWNRRDLLASLLEGLRRQSSPVAEILVVDNGSSDGSVEMAERSGARVLAMGRNAGFSAAVNRGIRECRSGWLAVVNNDVAPAPDWLERLLEAAQRPRVWFATGKLLSQSRRDTLDGTFDALSRGGCAWRAGHNRPDAPLWNRLRGIRFAPFTATLFRAALFERAGLLDERFESYLEDVDFCLRCARLGLWGLYVPAAVATHAGSATLGPWHRETVRLISRNQLLLVAKHYPGRWLARCAWPILVGQMLWGLVALRHGRGLAFLRGKLEGLRRFRTMRDPMPVEVVATILQRSEAEIFALQRRVGFDLYWRLYFLLTWLR